MTGGRRGKIWAVVLAAGESRRMGEAKLVLPFGRTTVIETVVRRCLESSLDGILVVLGHEWQKLLVKIKTYAVETTVNQNYKQGMLSSIQWGFRKLPREARAALIVLGDQPGISSQTIDRILSAFRAGTKNIVVPLFKKKPGHPLLVASVYRGEIAALDPATGLRGLLALHPQDILRLEVPDPNILQDIDNPEDYKKARKSTG